MFSKRFFRRFLNRLRGVPLVLACIGACACSVQGGQVTETPDPCAEVAEVCLSSCPENLAPGATAKDSCEASCLGSMSACHEHPFAEHCFMAPDQASYYCDGVPDPRTIAVGRACAYLGLSDLPSAPQHWICK